jgi:hypothetical protein
MHETSLGAARFRYYFRPAPQILPDVRTDAVSARRMYEFWMSQSPSTAFVMGSKSIGCGGIWSQGR